MALQDSPDLQLGLRIQAASNAMAGRPEQAHKAMAELSLNFGDGLAGQAAAVMG
jgi:hypothetical protein